jgi:2-polyprenyl-6-hydroxyphenyl methylase/3-demethylubiquinone-9 3-methyltransferase
VPEPQHVLRAIRTLLKPTGDAFVSTINRNLKAYLLAIVGAEYVMRLLERGTHTYERFIRPSELSRSARSAGLDVLDIAGLQYDPFSATAGLSNKVDVNYMMQLKRSS